MFSLFRKIGLLVLSLLMPFANGAQLCNDDGAQTMPAERYVIFGDDFFVRDRVTGLEWIRCAAGQAWDKEKGQCLEITKKQVKSWFSFNSALHEVERFRKKYNDKEWRLPTINELLTIVEHRCQSAATNLAVFPNTPSWRFWSISTMVENNDYAWVVNFEDGSSQTILKTTSSHYIRLVRGNSVLLNKPKTKVSELKDDLQKWDDGIHDLKNPDLTALQTYDEIIGPLPKGNSGHPDWAKALNQKLIMPRSNKHAEQANSLVIWQQDIIYKDTATMPWVKFPHKTHTQWLSCENCHDKIFSSTQEKADISMASIYTGSHCGACHGRVAFNVNTCERCHSILHDNISENGRKMIEE